MPEIRLSRGKVAVVDERDVPLLSLFRWHALPDFRDSRERWYACARLPGDGSVLMHRLITGAPRGMLVDHRDGDGLNNRRENLRLCTHAENVCNRGPINKLGIKGVTRHRGGRWQATIAFQGRSFYLGLYDSPEQAHAAYAAAAAKLHGEFARLTRFDGGYASQRKAAAE